MWSGWLPVRDQQGSERPRHRLTPPDMQVANFPSRVHGSSRLASFVGDAVCAECHAEIAASYARSGMSRSWQAIEPSLLEDLPEPSTVRHPQSGYSYRIVVEDGRVFQEESRNSGDAVHRLRREARFLVGSGTHAQAMVAEENGYLTQMPLAWFSGSFEWKLNPGFELSNRRFDRPILSGCISCHGTSVPHDPPTRNRYALPIPDGIGCERCHGSGRDHVDFWMAPKGEPADTASTIVNPARLTPAEANDVCFQCHLQGDVSIYPPKGDASSYRPGERLSEHRLDFLIAADKPESFGVASHAARMIRSRCYLESDRNLTCIHCHDPHRPVSDVPQEFFDARCATCHQPESCSRPVDDAVQKDAFGCVKCHMPQRGTREGQHLVFTDHWIRRPKDSGATPLHSPAPLAANSDVELVSLWPDADPLGVRLGSAYIKLHETMGPQRQALDRGIGLLEAALRKKPDDREARYWLASGYISRYRSPAAVALLAPLVAEDSDWYEARFRLALAYDQMQQYDAALEQYETLISAVPHWLEPYPLAARLYLYRQHPERAVALLEQQLQFRADAEAFAALGLAKGLRGDPLDECLMQIDRALALDPLLISAFLNRGILWTQAGRFERARRDYERVLELDPTNGKARAGLQTLRDR